MIPLLKVTDASQWITTGILGRFHIQFFLDIELFLSRKQVDLSDVAQSSPFVFIGSRSTTPAKVKGPTKLRIIWDTILSSVVQQRVENFFRILGVELLVLVSEYYI